MVYNSTHTHSHTHTQKLFTEYWLCNNKSEQNWLPGNVKVKSVVTEQPSTQRKKKNAWDQAVPRERKKRSLRPCKKVSPAWIALNTPHSKVWTSDTRLSPPKSQLFISMCLVCVSLCACMHVCVCISMMHVCIFSVSLVSQKLFFRVQFSLTQVCLKT